ncbi:L-glutamate gamma-semialdehyde dehydrogenase, partial [Salmonella enterica subsp. enterica serovar Infantis]
PLYLYRLLAHRPPNALTTTLTRQEARDPVDAQLKTTLLAPLTALTQWAADRPALPTLCRQVADLAQAGTQRLLPGPTG